MDNLSSLSLAIEKHELNGITSEISVKDHSTRTDSSVLTERAVVSNFSYPSAVENDTQILNETEQISYETAHNMFSQISDKNLIARKAGLEFLHRYILVWLKNGYNLEIECCNKCSPSCENEPKIGNVDTKIKVDIVLTSKTERHKGCTRNKMCIVGQIIASILRLTIRCPFSDVRDACRKMLGELKDQEVQIPSKIRTDVSHFIPYDQIYPADTDDEHVYALYVDSFVHNCRLEHMVMVMALHPQYLQCFLDTNFQLLQSNGMLSYPYKCYIAIMAAARHQCSYLVRLMEIDFLLQGGDKNWLLGLEHVPTKLRNLSTLNKLLAHRPWLVTQKHIEDLTGAESGCRWQLHELMQAIVLLCHFHSLAIFCFGTGVNLEIDHELLHTFHFNKCIKSTSVSAHNGGASNTSGAQYLPSEQNLHQISVAHDPIEMLMARMKKLHENQDEEEVTREEMDRRFEKEKREASQDLLPGGLSDFTGQAAYFDRYVIDPDFRYQDFAKRDYRAEIPTFRAQDYNWGDNAFHVVSSFYSELAELLDEKFKIAYNLTYKTLATKDNVDTTSLRRAIWKYVHCVYGIMYDDYNYDEVNQLLERPLKMFIKTVSCFPEQIEQNIYDGFWKQFRHSEKVHVSIMLQESRFQVGLLYGLRAFTQCIRDS